MARQKVCVYGICKNEAKFADRWMQSMGEADEVCVLDTGSDDGTPEKLAALGAVVACAKIRPWRFDVARNQALSLVPEDADICVCTDLDEVFAPGWREKLEKAWAPGAGRARYRYTWSFLPDGREGVVFWLDKIHCRQGYRWKGAVHEILQWQGPGKEPGAVFAEGIQLNHYPDREKSRGQYLPLLEIAVREEPENDRNMHYLGREYLYYGRYQEAIDTLKRHLTLKTALWADERCASMRFIARSFEALGDRSQAEQWYLRGIAEAPHLREPWLDYGMYAYKNRDWDLVVWLTERALQIRTRPRTYITEAASWGALPYDLGALGYYYTGRYEKALEQIKKALTVEPGNVRLNKNRQLIEVKLAK